MKKRLCLLLTSVMILGMSVNAFAADQENSTIFEYENYEEISETLISGDSELSLSELTYNDGKYQVRYSDTDNVTTDTQNSRIVVHYSKKIQIVYDNFDDVPSSYYYSEYSDVYHTYCAGTLTLTKVQLLSGKYWATFEGDLIGRA